jgi:hypothetical protein
MIEYVSPEEGLFLSNETLVETHPTAEGEFSSVTEACLKILNTCKHGHWYQKAYACPGVAFVCAPAAMVDGAKNISIASKSSKEEKAI